MYMRRPVGIRVLVRNPRLKVGELDDRRRECQAIRQVAPPITERKEFRAQQVLTIERPEYEPFSLPQHDKSLLPTLGQHIDQISRPVVEPVLHELITRGPLQAREFARGSSNVLWQDGIENITVASLSRCDSEQRERSAANDDGFETQTLTDEKPIEGGECLDRVHGSREESIGYTDTHRKPQSGAHVQRVYRLRLWDPDEGGISRLPGLTSDLSPGKVI